MNEKVQKFLESKKADEMKEYESKKARELIDLGLFEKEYSPENSYNLEYPFSEFVEGDYRYYKKVAVHVTDDEYKMIKKYSSKQQDTELGSPIVTALTIIAWIVLLGGFILGIMQGASMAEFLDDISYYNGDFSFATAFIYWTISAISGVTLLGIAEIIKLLTEIKDK